MARGADSLPPLLGDVDVTRLLRTVPPAHAIKGAFIGANADAVRAAWDRISLQLRAPPRAGKYLAFTDYPLSDHVLLADFAARRLYPGVPTCESHRLLSRATIDTFAKTTLGRVTLSLIAGPQSMLTKYQDIFNRMVTGPRVVVEVTGATSVTLTYRDYYSLKEAIVGVVEGAILACDLEPLVQLLGQGDGCFVANASWRPWA
jgi:uncharacterized protein (TIGR02265 family)